MAMSAFTTLVVVVFFSGIDTTTHCGDYNCCWMRVLSGLSLATAMEGRGIFLYLLGNALATKTSSSSTSVAAAASISEFPTSVRLQSR